MAALKNNIVVNKAEKDCLLYTSQAGPFMLDDLHPGVFPADGGGVVCGKTVNDKDFFRDGQNVCQTAADMEFLISGEDDNGEVKHGLAERALFDESGRVPAHNRPGSQDVYKRQVQTL